MALNPSPRRLLGPLGLVRREAPLAAGIWQPAGRLTKVHHGGFGRGSRMRGDH